MSNNRSLPPPLSLLFANLGVIDINLQDVNLTIEETIEHYTGSLYSQRTPLLQLLQ
jgi:hypothetical protein